MMFSCNYPCLNSSNEHSLGSNRISLILYPHVRKYRESDTTERLIWSDLISLVQFLSHVWLFVTPWTATHQASLSITYSSSLRLTSIESVMPSSHLILCHPLLLLPPIPPNIRVFSNESALIPKLTGEKMEAQEIILYNQDDTTNLEFESRFFWF